MSAGEGATISLAVVIGGAAAALLAFCLSDALKARSRIEIMKAIPVSAAKAIALWFTGRSLCFPSPPPDLQSRREAS